MSRFAGLGEALRTLRARRGESGRAVGEAVGTNASAVSRWELEREAPSLTTLGKLADHFDLHLGDLDDLLADVCGRSRRPRPPVPPRTAAEVEAYLDALLGPATQPAPGAEEDPLRLTLRPLLQLAGQRSFGNGGGRSG